jgi:large subunit ribosomal protein L17
MRHGVKTKKLGVSNSHRPLLMRNLATSLFEKSSMITTLTRAKTLKPFAEKLVTIAKTKDKMNAIRALKAVLFTDLAIENCFKIAGLSKDRNGGYTRVLRLENNRQGDNAPVGFIQLVDSEQSKVAK